MSIPLSTIGITAPIISQIMICQPIGNVTGFQITTATDKPIVSFVIPSTNYATCANSINACNIVSGCQAPSNILKYGATAIDYSCSLTGGTESYYACLWNPSTVANITTLSGSASLALSSSGAYSTSTLAPIAIPKNAATYPFSAVQIAAPITPNQMLCVPITDTYAQLAGGAALSSFELISTTDEPIVAFVIPSSNYANCSTNINKCTPTCNAPSNITTEGAVAIDLGCKFASTGSYTACIWNPSSKRSITSISGGVNLNPTLSGNFSRSSYALIPNTTVPATTSTLATTTTTTTASTTSTVAATTPTVAATATGTTSVIYNAAVSTGVSTGLFVMAVFLTL